MQKIIVYLLLIIFLFSFTVFSYDITNKNQGPVRESPKVDTSIPTRFKPMETTNLNDWLTVFPPNLASYKSADQFLVVPAMGMIAPIVELASDNPDFKSAIKGGAFDYNKYLVDGPTIYPGTAPVGNQGNTFIFAHSNYRHDKPGNFKNIFRLTYNIEKGDTILYYKKISGKRMLYTYKVTDSLLVNENDTRVMLPKKNKKELTLSACRPIGTAAQRRINKAELESEMALNYSVDPTKTNSGSMNNGSGSATGAISTGVVLEYNPYYIQQPYQLALDTARKVIIGH